jgi:hypothetical protein
MGYFSIILKNKIHERVYDTLKLISFIKILYFNLCVTSESHVVIIMQK